jgi:predicted RNA binding protein YcfA (HicA-like mRNA interferase family)
MSVSKLPSVRPKDVVRALEKLGFEAWRQKRSYLTLYRATDRRALTIPMHFAKDIPKGTLRTIIREAGLSVQEFVKLLNR